MTEINLDLLDAPFGEHEIEWRVQHVVEDKGIGLAVPYIDNRAIMNRLDRAVGKANWSNRYEAGPQGGIICIISIRIDGEWVSKSDGASNTDIEPVKGGLSDSMKRAAVQWGIGRGLYELDPIWHPVEKRGKTWQLVGKPALKPSTTNGHSGGSAQPPRVEQPAKPKSQTAAPDDATPVASRAAVSPDKLVTTLKTKATTVDVPVQKDERGIIESIKPEDAKTLAMDMESIMNKQTRTWILVQAFNVSSCKDLNPREAAAIRAWLAADKIAARKDAEGVKVLIERTAAPVGGS